MNTKNLEEKIKEFLKEHNHDIYQHIKDDKIEPWFSVYHGYEYVINISLLDKDFINYNDFCIHGYFTENEFHYDFSAYDTNEHYWPSNYYLIFSKIGEIINEYHKKELY